MSMTLPMHGDLDLPRFTLTEIELPVIREWEVNKDYYLVLKVKQISKRNHQHLPAKEDKSIIESDFQIMSIRTVTDQPLDIQALERQDFEDMVAKVKSGDA